MRLSIHRQKTILQTKWPVPFLCIAAHYVPRLTLDVAPQKMDRVQGRESMMDNVQNERHSQRSDVETPANIVRKTRIL